jgi:glycosyltransferase involved in cell wall biosynthesis
VKVLVSHPTGNTFVRALAKALYLEGQLSSLHTTVSWNPDSWLNWLVPSSFKGILIRRDFGVPSNAIHNHPFREIVRLVAGRMSWLPLAKQGVGWACLDNVYQNLDRCTSGQLLKEKPTHVHCYEDGALETFRVAKKLGIFCSYELPIAYWKALHELLKQEEVKRPEWSPTLVYGKDSPKKLQRKDWELDLADQIVVPSQFVRDSLPQKIIETKPVIISPFGTPAREASNSVEKPPPKPMRFLFVGSMGQRKGLADLLEAFSQIQRSDVQLVVMGSLMMPLEFYRKIYPSFIYECPRSHDKVLQLMQTCHVLALPSIVEGRALVQQEAMSQELALMITPNSGGEDLVFEGKTGHVIPPSSLTDLIQVIHQFADNPTKTLEMGKAAKKHAITYTWENYAHSIMHSYTLLN